MGRTVGHGLLAGAAGTTALNAATYLDMAVRARPASSTPEDTVERGADLLRIPIPGDEDTRKARVAGLGPLMGTAAGLGAGVVLSAAVRTGPAGGPWGTAGVAWVVAMLVGNGPMTVLGVTDPRTWRSADWLADVLPHAAYAGAAAAALRALDR